jgi:FkbM family methyltransferase
VGIGEGFRWYYDLCGARGLCAAACFRFFGMPTQLAIRPPGLYHRVRLRLGTSDFCAYKDVLVFEEKQYDPCIPNFNPKTIVDAGAHIGMTSLLFARKYPAAKILALEPERANFAALVTNVSPYSSVVPIQAALWKRDGEIKIGPSMAHIKGAFQVSESGTQSVRGITMETLLSETGIDSVDLLKLDIEGSEAEVFEAPTWINRVRVIAIELHDRIKPGCRTSVEAAAAGFRCEQRGEITFFFR